MLLIFLWRHLYLWLSFSLLLMKGLFSFVYASPEQEIPVLYQGRYRSAEAYARLWLYEFYHAQALKQADLASFHADSSSALHLLWSLDSLGSIPYQTAPLFWIKSTEVKQLAQLPLTRTHFSYQELQQALYHHPQSSESIISYLITYHFLTAYLDSSTPSLHLEISSLLPGLWVQWQGDDLIVSALPAQSPWPFLKKGEILASAIRTRAQEIVKRDKQIVKEWSTLFASLKEFEHLQSGPSLIESAFQNRLTQLQKQTQPPKEIERLLEQDYPLMQRLQMAGSLFKSLPSRYKEGEWFPFQALTIQRYYASSQSLKPVGNFTLFSDIHFEAVRQAYLDLRQALIHFSPVSLKEDRQQRFAIALERAYQPLGGKVFQEAHGKHLTYPTLNQLKIETLYVSYPWIPVLIFLYTIAACSWVMCCRLSLPHVPPAALGFTIFVFLCHTCLLAMRCYILGRPPVSNMFETVIYVPWVAICLSLLVPSFRRQPLVLLAACLTSIILLLILEVTHLNQSLDQVQAVLDSQFWLMIHVLLVVGSYGIFILGAILGHFYLGLFMLHRQETPTMIRLAQFILQTLYGGTTLLVLGTILGGIWAAESWGRFWDWDPKESWAFISICFYLIWIHAYRFHRIASFGLAIGAVSGLLAISFTWYGVNYILGTGLHSYGFGSGGERYYYAFLGVEGLFLIAALWIYFKHYPDISSSFTP